MVSSLHYNYLVSGKGKRVYFEVPGNLGREYKKTDTNDNFVLETDTCTAHKIFIELQYITWGLLWAYWVNFLCFFNTKICSFLTSILLRKTINDCLNYFCFMTFSIFWCAHRYIYAVWLCWGWSPRFHMCWASALPLNYSWNSWESDFYNASWSKYICVTQWYMWKNKSSDINWFILVYIEHLLGSYVPFK